MNMRGERQLGILAYLLEHRRTTAAELAARFEVARRTIHRDVEALSAAGIPVFAVGGAGGGIRLTEGFSLDADMLRTLRGKGLSGLLRGIPIDLGSHHAEPLVKRLSTLKEAVESRLCVWLSYQSASGLAERVVEPHLLRYQWGDWYLTGYCRLRGEFRTFKVLRIRALLTLEEAFAPRPVPEAARDNSADIASEQYAELLVDPACEHRLVEAYGGDSYDVLPEGGLLTRVGYRHRHYIVSWILSFGEGVEVLHPPELREEIAAILRSAAKRYDAPGG